MPEFHDPEREAFELEFSARPAPQELVSRLIDEIHHVTPDTPPAEGVSDLVPLADGRYVYDESPPYPLGVGRVGLTELQFIDDPAALEEQARYDVQFIAGESGAEVNGSVEDLVAHALHSPDYFPITRYTERTFEYGGYGGTEYHETLGVSYFPCPDTSGEHRPTLFELGVLDPQEQRLRVSDAREWTELVRLKRLDQQLNLPEPGEPDEV